MIPCSGATPACAARAGDDGFDVVGGGGLVDDGAHGPVAVQDDGLAGPQGGHVQALGPGEAGLLLDGEDELQRAAGGATGVDGAQGFQDGGDPGLVVRAEDGGAVRAHDPVFDPGLDPDPGLHRVHVGAQDQGGGAGAGAPAGADADEVAGGVAPGVEARGRG